MLSLSLLVADASEVVAAADPVTTEELRPRALDD
jgi:hypothetical protein